MALADSRSSIGAVSELLKSRLTISTTAATVDIGRPEAAASTSGPKFNLFLYQVDIDGHLRNTPLDPGQAAPLWVVLHYLLTPFDADKESDSIDAHRLLSEGMLALQELNYLRPTGSELRDNPEPLSVTFDSADSELLSKVMQGTDEKYRVSVGFQVRPVMIAPATPPGYALPVTSVGSPPFGIVVVPSLGPTLESLTPEKFEAGEQLTLRGVDLGGQIDQVRVGPVVFGVTAAKTGEIQSTVAADTDLSPGSYPVVAARLLPGSQYVTSNALLGHLLPSLTSAQPAGLVAAAGRVSGSLTLNGHHLGRPGDSIFVAFYRDGVVVRMFEAAGADAQTSLTVAVSVDDALPAGEYFVIVRVNGQQARHAPQVSWT